jgi:hypothetical protein
MADLFLGACLGIFAMLVIYPVLKKFYLVLMEKI